MMWLSKSTTKWLSADLKFKEQEEKKEKAEEAAEAKDGNATADATATDGGDASADGDDAAASRLMKALEFAAWGL